MRIEHLAVPGLNCGISLVVLIVSLLSACSDIATAPRELSTANDLSTAGTASPAASVPGALLYVDPSSPARKQVAAWRESRPADAAQMEKIASQPHSVWLGEWIADPFQFVDDSSRRITDAGAMPVYVLYWIPERDCGQHSRGGAGSAAAYRLWVAEIARGLGRRRAAVIVEPDALAGMDCLKPEAQSERLSLIRDAVRTLRASGSVSVYIDAGHPIWHPAEQIAQRLRQAGIEGATGFALNVANHHATEENVRYGEAVSAATGGKHFVVDTGRNGLGSPESIRGEAAWCNAEGRALGSRPTTSTGHPLVDAFLWVKYPGESDGKCNGGPSAGVWWAEYALGLASRG